MITDEQILRTRPREESPLVPLLTGTQVPPEVDRLPIDWTNGSGAEVPGISRLGADDREDPRWRRDLLGVLARTFGTVKTGITPPVNEFDLPSEAPPLAMPSAVVDAFLDIVRDLPGLREITVGFEGDVADFRVVVSDMWWDEAIDWLVEQLRPLTSVYGQAFDYRVVEDRGGGTNPPGHAVLWTLPASADPDAQ